MIRSGKKRLGVHWAQRLAILGLMLVIGTPAMSAAQQRQYADNGPLFIAMPGNHVGNRSTIDVSDAPILQRRLDLEFDRVPLEAALHEVGRLAGLHFVTVAQAVPLDKLVSMSASHLTVAAALTELLIGTGVDVQLSSDEKSAALVPKAGRKTVPVGRRQGAGTIGGRVTDAATRVPLDQVAVRIDGLGLGAVTTSDGHYTIRSVPLGTYRITARRVGYTPLTKTVSVATNSTAIADFMLLAVPTRLNEMVTTAVGDQRRYEVGNTISTINADSIAPTAPITSLTDLISARAPGVEVVETSGMTGSGEAIRIRGLSSLVLQNDPILIVDGVRQDNSAGGDVSSILSAGSSSHPTPTRLNDIDFKDVQTIDILKGPSASTEYGTDAANGVIVITTKHGTPGRPQWGISAEQTQGEIPARFPDGYYSWGHLTDGTRTPVNCQVVASPLFSASSAATGQCIVDSVTRDNPLNSPSRSIFGTGNRAKYDLSVSGGSDVARYFVSGGLSNEIGVIRMPPVLKLVADTAHLGLPTTALSPNREQQRSVRMNTAIKLASTADLTATGSYLSTYQQTPDAQQLYYSVFTAPALGDAAHAYGYGSINFGISPLGELSSFGSQNTNRVTGGLAANWRPLGWFVGHATVGLDHGSQRSTMLNYPVTNPAFAFFTPFLGLADAATDVYSADLRGTATASPASGLRLVTSIGLQVVDNRTVGQSASVSGITATNLTLNGSAGPTVQQFANRQATFGGYGEEQVGLADRFFLTGALRVDAGSGFGSAHSTAAYPKASASWLAVDRGQTTIRLRGAFGESGVQPMNGAAQPLYTPAVVYLGGTTTTAYPISWPGNQNLRPERTAEFEGGVDLGGWGNRVSVELTGYSKTTHDALVNVNLGETLSNYTYQENIGRVKNTGVEASATVGIVRARSVSWDAAISASANHNRLVSLAPGLAAQQGGPTTFVQYRQAPGYPLYGIWTKRVTYADVNHDGIIEPSEVTTADSASFIGPSLPTREASVSTHLALWRGAVTVGGLADYRGDYRIANEVLSYGDFVGRNRESNDPKAPLALQAAAVAENRPPYPYPAQYVEDGSFVRVREISVTYAVPQALTRALRLHSLGVTGAVRNLALWTRYTGIDPETSNTSGQNIQPVQSSGGNLVNNNLRADGGSVPLLRYWVVRLNMGL